MAVEQSQFQYHLRLSSILGFWSRNRTCCAALYPVRMIHLSFGDPDKVAAEMNTAIHLNVLSAGILLLLVSVCLSLRTL